VATYLGLNPPGFAAQVVALAFGLAAATLFPTLMMGIFSKRMNSAGATAGMLAGLISTCLYLFLYLGWFFIPGTAMLTRGQYLFGIPPTHFGPIGALFNFGVAYLVSNATAAPPKEIQDLVESVRIPRGAGAALITDPSARKYRACDTAGPVQTTGASRRHRGAPFHIRDIP
jgi:cation/acetate symporter